MRIYLGVHRFAPNAAVSGDMGWTSPSTRRKITMLRFWNKLVDMDNNRTTKLLFNENLSLSNIKGAWSYGMKKVFAEINMINSYEQMEPVCLNTAWALLHERFCERWKNEVHSKPKLRTYKLFKDVYSVEPYVLTFMNRKQRSFLAQLRCGILPLEIETGRWSGIAVENRICKLCNVGETEDELHFLFRCAHYIEERQAFYSDVAPDIPDFVNSDDTQNFCTVWDKTLLAELASM